MLGRHPRAFGVVDTDHNAADMGCQITEVAVRYVEYGTGMPLVALHGAGVDHREIEAAVEAIVSATGYRRIYPGREWVARQPTA